MTVAPILDSMDKLLTPLIAILALYIAYRQWKLDHVRLNHDLFERRLAVFGAVQELVLGVMWSGKVDQLAWEGLILRRHQAIFLFKKDVCDYLDEIERKAERLKLLNKFSDDDQLREFHETNPLRDSGKTLPDELRELQIYFNAELPRAKSIFLPYIRLY